MLVKAEELLQTTTDDVRQAVTELNRNVDKVCQLYHAVDAREKEIAKRATAANTNNKGAAAIHHPCFDTSQVEMAPRNSFSLLH